MNIEERIKRLIIQTKESLASVSDCIIQEKTNAASYLIGYLQKELEQLFNILEENLHYLMGKTINPILLKKIQEIHFTIRTKNCLTGAGYKYLGQLVQASESDLIKIPNLGKASLREIKVWLNEHLLSLNMEISNWGYYLEKLLKESENVNSN